MAEQYVLADEMFPTEFGGGFTGHPTLVAGTNELTVLRPRGFPNEPPDDSNSPPGARGSMWTPNATYTVSRGHFHVTIRGRP